MNDFVHLTRFFSVWSLVRTIGGHVQSIKMDNLFLSLFVQMFVHSLSLNRMCCMWRRNSDFTKKEVELPAYML